MTPYCNFDTNILINGTKDHESSDCINYCTMIDHCSPQLLGNGICDPSCNTKNCGYDWGDCGVCSSFCSEKDLMGNCNLNCNVPGCYYGLSQCEECSPGCSPDLLGNGYCDEACATSNCNFDLGDCINRTCAPNCYIWMVGNSICEEACYVADCDYDKFDCDCAPGCYDYMLNNGICDEACNNWNCVLDNHDCGACASGCYPSMVGNGVCDPECNNYDCYYDYTDCQCADNCLLEDYGKCKPDCLVASCNYDQLPQYPNLWCQNNALRIFVSYQHIIRNDTTYIVYLEDCYQSSNYACTPEKAFDFENCNQECNIRQCNYAFGNCNYYWGGNYCNRYYRTDENLIQCLSCNNLAVTNRGCSIGERNFWTTFPDGSKFILYDYKDRSTKNNPYIYFATSKVNEELNYGDGTLISPYNSIIKALDYTMHAYSIIYLLEDGDYPIYQNDRDLNSEDPEWAKRYYKKKLVKIEPINGNKVKFIKLIDQHTWKNKTFVVIDYSLQISNVIFDGKTYPSTCSNISSEYCEYCPYVIRDSQSSTGFYNDRLEEISIFLPSSWCARSKEFNLFFSTGHDLTLINSDIINFRSGFLSLIYQSNGNLYMNNVAFDNIKLTESEVSAVISLGLNSYDLYCLKRFYYENGKVSRLNNGYEFGDSVNFRGFLYASNMTKILIRNVIFEYNLVYMNQFNLLDTASLLTLGYFQTLEIDSCIFSYNYCELGIINVLQATKNLNMTIDSKGVLADSKLSHIHIRNTSFLGNYGKTSGILYAQFNIEPQNILIESCNFTSNGVERGSLLYFGSNGNISDYAETKYVTVTMLNGLNSTAKYLARWVKLANINFLNNYSGTTDLVDIRKMVNIEITNIEMKLNGGKPNESNSINSILLNSFISNPDIYLKLSVPNPQVLSCTSLFSVSNSLNFIMKFVNATENYCKNSSPSFIINSTENSVGDYLYFNRNIGEGAKGVCISVSYTASLLINNSMFISSQNTVKGNSGAVAFSDSSNNLTLANCSFIGNSADLGGAVYFSGQTLSMNDCVYESNQSPGLSGGAIYYYLPPTLLSLDSFIYISDTIFRNNYGSFNGGSLYLQKSYFSNSTTHLIISNSDFYSNRASSGAAVFIDSFIRLSKDSLIESCLFEENIALLSGIFSIYFNSGILYFDRSSFIGNSGVGSSALLISIDSESNSKIALNNCTFQYNSGETTVLLEDSNKNSTLETYNCMFTENIGSAFSLNNGILIENNSTIQNGHSLRSGGSITMKNSALANCTNTTFLNNTSDENGGAISMNLNSQFLCMHCKILKNKAGESGGAIYVDTDSFFLIEDSKFTENYCKHKGSVLNMISSSVDSKLMNCEITKNNAQNGGIISLIWSLITIDSLIIHSNTANQDNPGILLTNSNITIVNTSFSDQIGDQGCFIQIKSESVTTIKNSSFINGLSNSSGTALFSLSSMAIIIDSYFSNLVSKAGGSLFIYKDGSLNIYNSTMKNIIGSSIDAYHSFVQIEKAIFQNLSDSTIVGNEIASLEIMNSEFYDGSGSNGGAVYCSKCMKISIESCLFYNNSASSGGAIYLMTDIDTPISNQYVISSSVFVSNFAFNGGAILASNINLHVLFSEFIDNLAGSSDTENREAGIYDGIGGGIKINCDKFDSCSFNISSNHFTRNKAINNGGAISWDSSNPVIIDNFFVNNSARYGPDIASYPFKLIYINTKRENQYLNSPSSSMPTISGIAPGQKSEQPITCAIVDHYDQIIYTDNLSQVQLLANDPNTILFGTTTVTAFSGIFNFTDYVVIAPPGSSTKIKVYAPTIEDSNNFLINVFLRLCKIGEATASNQCVICEKPYYSLELNNTECITCPEHAVCYGNSSIVPKEGYWRESNDTEVFWRCPNPSACLGSPDPKNLSYTGVCKKGYEGKLCQACQYGYGRLYENYCKICPERWINFMNFFGFIGVLTVITLLIWITVKKSILGTQTYTPVYIKIFWNYLHILTIITTFNLNWPKEIMKLFHIESSMNFIMEQIFSIDCFLQLDSQKSVFYTNFFIISSAPFLLGNICLILLSLYFLYKKKSFSEFSHYFISIWIVLLFLIHPHLMQPFFKIFSCKEISQGEFWLNENLEIQCWTSEHLFYAFSIGLPSILLWGILGPAYLFTKVLRLRRVQGGGSDKLKYEFICHGYTTEYFYWEFFIFYSKIILICFSVYLSNITLPLQALTAIVILILFFHFQNRNKPFTDTYLNNAELLAKLILLITIFTGLFFATGKLDYSSEVFIFIITIFANLLFILYILPKIFSSFLKDAKDTTLILLSRLFKRKKYKIGYETNTQVINNSKYLYITGSRIINSTQDIELENFSSILADDRNKSIEIDPCPSENRSINE
ncbi:unnamed protein product [Blepharisma stoltei]|uniref:LNR domain-containing protein n=1 Tax=Blepharisma stoltei TaxID=1481888 RepID=A0AAU9JTQ2_9CILI|nr:unnamed protein product [Blepharisma stoltei]